ncbi:DUF1120 domain-containing protein [Pragia fontium]|uniref:DUF1120 domain-containing protein n=2 Tax=Pragia fontium TaxID=82985 RepID=A0AAJ4W7Q3_9GAMM|nr:DUF1120 domain-containing protein [Pragia fontium]GKX62953.1 hypothetical protein SOASR032_15220 [Pragia fontium]SFC01119.1 Protein of unknown function [Pragia fontium DSM 5563 = ATCC 49100]SUB81646.1 Protein of uncharacterised function (DUF1120) [Pragia fontium]VEJ54130.1 Protein of uncharacterised function (DUF1120) [Pragia fontium]
MKVCKSTALFLLFVTSTCSLSAIAAESARITVKGTLAPSACAISIDGSADYGNLKIGELKEQGPEQNGYQLKHKPVNFNIQCSTPAKVAISAQADSQPATKPGFGIRSYFSDTSTMNSEQQQLGILGMVGEQELGYFTAILASATVDGDDAELIYSDNNGSTWAADSKNVNSLMNQDGTKWHTWGKGLVPQSASNIAGIINISAAVDPKVVDEAKDAINFSANTTITLQYL